MSQWSRFVAILMLASSVPCSAGSVDLSFKEERQIEVAMRMIGHQVLLAVGDHTSLVLPVVKDGDRYKIRFGSSFGFEPSALTNTIDSVVSASKIATRYVVEFVSCDSNLIVHSWKVAEQVEDDMIPCQGRAQPVACYELWFTIIEPHPSAFHGIESVVQANATVSASYTGRWLIALTLFVLAIVAFIALRRKRKVPSAPIDDLNLVQIGEFQFNKRNMELSFKNDRVRLTSKEADLLQLLSASPNNTVGRDEILATVWGDEGDYVGRTLDVFVSKLRKKLEADANVRIVNIRGVGYRLVLGE